MMTVPTTRVAELEAEIRQMLEVQLEGAAIMGGAWQISALERLRVVLGAVARAEIARLRAKQKSEQDARN